MDTHELRKFAFRLRHSERLVLAEQSVSGTCRYPGTSCVPLEQITSVVRDAGLCMISYANGTNLFVYLRKHRFKQWRLGS